MPNVVEEAAAEAFDAVKADLVSAVRNHPQYAQILDGLTAKAIASLVAMVA